MTQDNNNKNNTKKKMKKKKKFSIIRLIIVIILMVAFIGAGAVGGLVLATAKNAPEIDPTKISLLLNENSVILDENGKLIEKVQTNEYRTYVDLDKIPDHLEKAFIAIEDERFEAHMGVDIRGILGAIFDKFRSGGQLRGASTITQQLARNLYLSNDRSLDRKIQEAYLAIQIEKVLMKDQIMEAYLNRIDLSQRSYGVQEAAQTYFSKDVEQLTIAESAIIAGIVKSPPGYSPYNTVPIENVKNQEDVIGELDIDGKKYAVVFNQASLERQRIILNKMKELTFITEEEYKAAVNEDIKAAIKPGQKKISGISSYFTDYVKTQVVDALVSKAGYSREDAERELYTGGLKIYSTMDISLQHKLEGIYNNFGKVLFGDINKIKGPMLIDWSADKNGNIIDDKRSIVFYKDSNLLDSNMSLKIDKGTFSISEDGNLVIKNNKLNIYSKSIDVQDYYTVDDNKNLVTHTTGSLALAEGSYSISDAKEIVIKSDYLSKNKDFYSTDENGNLIISSKYFFKDTEGVVQPQAATVIFDYRSGEIRALVGGREIKGNKLLNRATSSQRQPGSAIKPLAVYLPALDNGYTAADIIDDVPYYDERGTLWPKNWYPGFRGLTTLRQSVEQSVNVNAVKLVSNIGVKTSMEYLARLGIIKEDGKDNFVTREEDKRYNDENLSALGLGGMTKGLSPMEITAAYGAIANQGIYTEPIAFTKVLDRDGNVILENKPNKTSVVTPQVAYIMSNILNTTVTSGIAQRAQIFPSNTKIPIAGKTGTTQDKGDIWFVGYSPYYAAGVWIGNDVPKIKLSNSSSIAAELWSEIMKEVHSELSPKSFDVPQGLVTKQICIDSGKLATELCSRDPRGSRIRTEIFAKGTEPSEFCDVHVEIAIDTSTGKIATENCPPELVENRVFIKREPAYIPEENGGLVPTDYQYTAPTEECDSHTTPPSTGFDDWLRDWFNNGDNGENTNEPPGDQGDENSEDNND